jgi:phenylacetate-CoA ligase
MTLKAETVSPHEGLKEELAATLRAVTKLGGTVELTAAGSLPNDGKMIADERS